MTTEPTDAEAPTRGKPGRRARLSREQALGAALATADADGIEAVTMQRIAHAIGAEPMSLYRHVRNKEDLLDGLVDLVFAEIEVPSPSEPWRSAMRRHASATRRVLRRHPWALGLLESRSHPGPANLGHHEAVLANLFAAGFSPASAVRAYNLLDSFVYGFALQEHTLPVADPDALVEVAPEMLAQYAAGAYPNLARVATELVASGFRYADEFEPGLDLILDGLERQLAPASTGRASPGRRRRGATP
jgi:AcrR family transcriptional regulator